MRRWRVLALVLWTLIEAGDSVRSIARRGAAGTGRDGLRYRRVRVPQERIADYTRGYLPMERSAFQSTAVADPGPQPGLGPPMWPGFESADYQAVFSEGQLISGQATLQITHVAAKPTVLSLAPCGLAIGAATWQHAETTTARWQWARMKPAICWRWSASPGELHSPWTLRGVTNEWGECRFELSLAAAPLESLRDRLAERPRVVDRSRPDHSTRGPGQRDGRRARQFAGQSATMDRFNSAATADVH